MKRIVIALTLALLVLNTAHALSISGIEYKGEIYTEGEDFSLKDPEVPSGERMSPRQITIDVDGERVDLYRFPLVVERGEYVEVSMDIDTSRADFSTDLQEYDIECKGTDCIVNTSEDFIRGRGRLKIDGDVPEDIKIGDVDSFVNLIHFSSAVTSEGTNDKFKTYVATPEYSKAKEKLWTTYKEWKTASGPVKGKAETPLKESISLFKKGKYKRAAAKAEHASGILDQWSVFAFQGLLVGLLIGLVVGGAGVAVYWRARRKDRDLLEEALEKYVEVKKKEIDIDAKVDGALKNALGVAREGREEKPGYVQGVLDKELDEEIRAKAVQDLKEINLVLDRALQEEPPGKGTETPGRTGGSGTGKSKLSKLKFWK